MAVHEVPPVEAWVRRRAALFAGSRGLWEITITMRTSIQTVSRGCRLFWTACLGAAALSGCVHHDDEGVLTAAPQRVQTVLAAGRAGDISLFGDLPGTADSAYFSRTAVSLRQHTFSEVGADFDPDIDPTGERIVFASTRHHMQPDLYLKRPDGVAVTQLTADPAADVQPCFSPDGTRVAFASNRSGNWDIWITASTGGPPVQVTAGPADDVHPSWSPDGSKLVYSSLPAQGGPWELWIADAAAGSTRRFIGYGLFPEWSPVADVILFQRARERGSRWFSIWTMTLIDGEPRLPTELVSGASQAMILPTWSRDGTQIAFVGTATPPPLWSETGPLAVGEVYDIWLMNSDGTRRVRLTDGYTANYAPAFSPDGRVYFTSNRAGRENIWSVAPAGPSSDLRSTERGGQPSQRNVG